MTFGFEEVKETGVPPPLEQEEALEEKIKPQEEISAVEGWPLLKPVAVTPILRLKASVLAERTGWDGWLYTDKEIEDISELIDACGIRAPAWAQLIGALGLLDVAKYAQYRMWKAEGKPAKKEGKE